MADVMEHIARHHDLEARVRPWQRIGPAGTQLDIRRQLGLRHRQHLGYRIDSRQPCARMACAQSAKQFTGAAADVEHALIAAQRQPRNRLARSRVDVVRPPLVVARGLGRIFGDQRVYSCEAYGFLR